MTMRAFRNVPQGSSAGMILTPELGQFGVILPIARTNLVTNPSGETTTTGYTAVGGSVARSTTDQYHGAYSLAITPTAGTTDGAYYGTVSLTAGTPYAISCKIRGAAGVPYRLGVRTTAAVELTGMTFRASGRWEWRWFFWTETNTTTRRVYLTKDTNTSTAVVYWDGLQVEACETGNVFPTTYIDGDQLGLLANQFPPAYVWAGTPHASISSRSSETRAGGRVVNIQDVYRFFLTAIAGLGMTTPGNVLLNYAQADGATIQDIRLPPRSFQIAGFFSETSMPQIERQKAQLSRAVSRDLAGLRQPIVLTYQPTDCGEPVGMMTQIACVYSGGLEGNISMPLRETAILSFTQYVPYLSTGDQGATLSVTQTLATANSTVQRSPLGVWAAMSTGVTVGGSVASIAKFLVARDGTVYAGGLFDTAGGVSANNIATWNGSAWAVVGAAAAINSNVMDMIQGADGTIYVGGLFTNANGVANADGIATWNGSAWGALSTGVAGGSGAVNALAISPVDGTIYAGGSFTSIGTSTSDNIGRWNGTTWQNLTSDTALNNQVLALAVGRNGVVYAGGDFTNAGGVGAADYIASWSGVAWAALPFNASAPANGQVSSLAIDQAGNLWAGGAFTTIGGTAAPENIAYFNGTQWIAPPATGNSGPSTIDVAPDGRVYVGWLTASGTGFVPDATIWDGTAWAPVDATLADATTFAWKPDGTMYAGNANAVAAVVTAGTTAVTNSGSGNAYPRVTFTGTGSPSAVLYHLINATTGATIYFDTNILSGEILTLDLNPQAITFTSSLSGNILGRIAPGSTLTGFFLQPGVNSIVCFATGTSPTVVMQWPETYQSISELVE